jgi:hypothetical protein
MPLSTAPVAQSSWRQETLAMQIPVLNQPHSALALPVMPGWAVTRASATLACAILAAVLYSLSRLDAYFRRRRQGRQEGLVKISDPANPQFESVNPFLSQPTPY